MGSSGITGAFASLGHRSARDAAIPVFRVRCPCIPHPSAANIPFGFPPGMSARLACLNHAASVRSEPGSNSSLKKSVSDRPRPMGPDGSITTDLGLSFFAFVRMKAAGSRKNRLHRALAKPAPVGRWIGELWILPRS